MAVLNFFPAPITFAQANVAAGATFAVYPTSGPGGPAYNGLALPPNPFVVFPTAYSFPRMNTRQMVFLNTGGNPILFGVHYYQTTGTVPSPFGSSPPIATGPGNVNPVEGFNCTRLPAGASLSIDLDTFERRGSFNPSEPNNMGGNTGGFPTSAPFFFGIGGLSGQVDITYINTFGAF
jgi:hypothetical protein